MNPLQKRIFRILEEQCHEQYNLTNSFTRINEVMCEAIFDGLYCWNYTKAGVLEVQPCSNNIVKSTIQVSSVTTKTPYVYNMWSLEYVI